MAGLIRDADNAEPPSEHEVCSSLYINGVRYANTAAKFWPALIDEALAEYPECDTIRLSAPGSDDLDRDLLFPERSLARDLERLFQANAAEEWRRTLAELEILGPPATVRLTLLAGDEELLARPLPDDRVDADIFPYLIVWLLEWAELPPALWNNEHLQGRLSANDRKRGITYEIAFQVVVRHLSEGLFERTLTLFPTVTYLA